MLTVGFLQTLAGNTSAAEQSYSRFASGHPWVAPHYVAMEKAVAEMYAALERKDGQAALTHAASVPNVSRFLFLKGWAHFLVGDDASAEAEFRKSLLSGRFMSNNLLQERRFPATAILAHYYLGQMYERAGKHDQAINEYQEFLSRFEGSHTRLPQVAKARANLKRLMQ